MLKLPKWVVPGSAVLFCIACSALQSPAEHSRSLARDAGFVPLPLPDARLTAFVRKKSDSPPDAAVTVYIESDGAPWRFADEPPADPTPLKPFVMRMAVADTGSRTAYLSRPCQYLSAAALRECDPGLWMQARFSNEAVSATNAAVDRIKTDTGASRVNLVGYSGGGAMAALVAARRSDVHCLTTIGAPLDTDAWTNSLQVSRLDRSLNPADVAPKLTKLPQTHYRGLKDQLVRPATTERFISQAKPGAVVIDERDFDHQCCWSEQWLRLSRATCLAESP